jgi:inositol 1,4,5-triphosphate receptor type 1/inositol 1,4,5-triphosphate receptor type 3
VGQLKKGIQDCIQALLPPIMRTGTSVDDNDPNFAKQEGTFSLGGLSKLGNFNLAVTFNKTIATEGTSKDIEAIDINKILETEIFPSLIALFCMTQSLAMETKLLNLLTRFYNQRFEFASLTTQLLLLFDDQKIKVFQSLKKNIKTSSKFIEDCETWMKDLENNKTILSSTLKIFTEFNHHLFHSSDPNKEIDVVRQNMMRNLKVHELGINLIRNGIESAFNDDSK